MADLQEEKVNLDGEFGGIEARHEEELEAERARWNQKFNDLRVEYVVKIKNSCKAVL